LAKQIIVGSILKSLENDVNLCLSLPFNKTDAPTNAYSPATIYCFSVIDLLGSLYAGNARGGDNTQNARRYMKKFMKYSPDDALLLQRIYRHKLVHLAMPKAVILHKGQLI
jgi:hypothetical protein